MVNSDKELEKMEKGLNIWQEVLDGVCEVQSGKGKKVSVTRFSTDPTSFFIPSRSSERSLAKDPDSG